MQTTTLVTFILQHSSAQSVELYGSWDNFAEPWEMRRDNRRACWIGCHKFSNIVYDGDSEGFHEQRDGGLKMGGTYWYYYRIDNDEEYYDPAQPCGTSCPLLPGQRVNILEVPFEKRYISRSRSSSVSFITALHTMNPQDRYITPRRAPSPASKSRLPQLPKLNTKFNREYGVYDQTPITNLSKAPEPKAWSALPRDSLQYSKDKRQIKSAVTPTIDMFVPESEVLETSSNNQLRRSFSFETQQVRPATKSTFDPFTSEQKVTSRKEDTDTKFNGILYGQKVVSTTFDSFLPSQQISALNKNSEPIKKTTSKTPPDSLQNSLDKRQPKPAPSPTFDCFVPQHKLSNGDDNIESKSRSSSRMGSRSSSRMRLHSRSNSRTTMNSRTATLTAKLQKSPKTRHTRSSSTPTSPPKDLILAATRIISGRKISEPASTLESAPKYTPEAVPTPTGLGLFTDLMPNKYRTIGQVLIGTEPEIELRKTRTVQTRSRACSSPAPQRKISRSPRVSPKARSNYRAFSEESGLHEASHMLRDICSGQLMREKVVPPAFELPEKNMSNPGDSPLQSRVRNRSIDISVADHKPQKLLESGPELAIRVRPATSRRSSTARKPVPLSKTTSKEQLLQFPPPIPTPAPAPVPMKRSSTVLTKSDVISHWRPSTVLTTSYIGKELDSKHDSLSRTSATDKSTRPRRPSIFHSDSSMDLNKHLPLLPKYLIPEPLFSSHGVNKRDDDFLQTEQINTRYDKSRFSAWTEYNGAEMEDSDSDSNSDSEAADEVSATFSDIHESEPTTPTRYKDSFRQSVDPMPMDTPVTQMRKLIENFENLGDTLF